MIPTISIATASFYYWQHSLPGLRLLEEVFWNLLTNEEARVAGFEIYGSPQELFTWAALLKKGLPALPPPLVGFNKTLCKKILSLTANSVHLPNLEKQEVRHISKFMNIVFEATGISRFVLHPCDVECSFLLQLAESVHPNISISCENMDPRKRSFRTLQELEALLSMHERFSVTLDICHYIENGNSSDSEELLSFLSRYHKRVLGVHFSVPTSRNETYKKDPNIDTTHYLAWDSGCSLSTAFFDMIPDHSTIVVEGVIPYDTSQMLRSEISFIRSRGLLDNASSIKFA
jgi:hypothetical protein